METKRLMILVAALAAAMSMVACDLGTDPLPDQACVSDAECPQGLHCLSEPGVCVQCLQDSHCLVSKNCNEEKHVCEEVEPQCISDAECAVNSICDVGVCDAGKCTTVPAPSTVTCDDGDPCTADDACQQGQCAGTPIDGCGQNGCEGLKDGTACDDGDDCTASDECKNGVCEGLGVPGCGFPEDLDEDGYSQQDGDCNDNDPTVHPEAPELCDQQDNNCNGTIDEECVTPVCFASGCNMEVCSEADVDSDCTWKPEFDCLPYTVCGAFGPEGGCGWEMNELYVQCLKSVCVPSPEVCDNQDNDCNGEVDENCGTACGGFAGLPCHDGEYCQYIPDSCFGADVPGTCVKIPYTCPDYYSPVCGCDGITYSNECEMAANQMSLWKEGECGNEACKSIAGYDFGFCLAILGYGFDGTQCVMVSGCECGEMCPWIFPTKQKCEEACGTVTTDCTSDEECPPGMICQVYCGNGWCQGECQWQTPGDEDQDGWTGEDGDCNDNDATVYPGAPEECDQVDNNCNGNVDEGCGTSGTCGGFMGAQCPSGQYCLFTLGSCGAADEMGKCMPKPAMCPLVYKPVCGCDNNTYNNECEAAMSGVSVWSEGTCAQFACLDLKDIDFGACAMFMGYGVIGGACAGISGCGCGNHCDSIFPSEVECKEACF